MHPTPKTPERDRAATERRLLEALGEMVGQSGFEKIGINALAARSGVSKILIYRYFESIEGLMAAYIRQHDFWINFPQDIPSREALPDYLKAMFRGQVARLRNDPTLRRLHRWELSADNEILARLRGQREQSGLTLVRNVSRLTGRPESEVAALATLVTASVSYLVMLGEFCLHYNGIPLGEEAGWEQLEQGIDLIVDNWLQNGNT